MQSAFFHKSWKCFGLTHCELILSLVFFFIFYFDELQRSCCYTACMHDCTVLCVSPSEKRCDCVWPLNCTCPPIWTWKTLTILVSPGQAVFCVFYLMHAGKCSSPTGIEYLNRNAMDKKTNECLVHKEIKIQLAPSLYTYLSTPARSPSICLPHKRLKYRHWLKLQPSALKEARHTHIHTHKQQ